MRRLVLVWVGGSGVVCGLGPTTVVDSSAKGARASLLPSHVDEWAVEVTRSTWDGVELACLTVSNDPDVDGLLSVAHPQHPRFRALNELADPHGAMGVWPSAWAATAALGRGGLVDVGKPLRVLEIGAGAGLPSLYASVVLGASRVLATDVEAVPLAFLKAARSAHDPEAPSDAFETGYLDVLDADYNSVDGYDVIVAADLLYNSDVAFARGV